jgi:uncharacterized membrane protein HdeD (DUF308 family)
MPTPEASTLDHPIYGNLKIKWGWMLALGILMVVLGLVGLGMAFALTIVTVIYFGILAIIAGAAQVIDAFSHQTWKSFVWHLLIGIVYIAAGGIMIFMPLASAFWLTVFLAISLIVIGLVRIVMAFQLPAEMATRIWVIVAGIITLALGILVFSTIEPPSPEALQTQEGLAAWAEQWGWVIGLFVAIDLIMHGVALAAIALAAKSSVDDDSGASGPSSGRRSATA